MKSRTVWVNAILFGLGILGALKPEIYEGIRPIADSILPELKDNEASITGIIIGVTAIVNLWLRMSTTKPVTLTTKPKEE